MNRAKVQEWYSAAELAALGLPGMPTTKPGVLHRVRDEGWMGASSEIHGALQRKRKGRGGGVEFHITLLPEAAQARLMAAGAEAQERLDPESAWLRLEKLPQTQKGEAQHRLDVVQRVEHFQRLGMRKNTAVEQVVGDAARDARARGAEPPLKVATIYTWFARIDGVAVPDRLAYLAPDYTGRTATADCTPDAWEFYKGAYLRLSKPTHASSYRDLQVAAGANGWAIPSQKTLQRRVEAEVPPPLQTLYRYGSEALDHSFPHRDRDRSGLLPMQILNLDGHTWDVFVKWPNGTISRPYALAVQDIASSRVLAVRHDFTLNHHQVRLALGDTFRDHGLCDVVLMDNGRENGAQAISGGQRRLRWGKTPEQDPAGLLKTLGIVADFAKPHWGQSKPIERAFRNFAHDIAKCPEFEGAYTGHNPMAKPENYQSRAIPFAEFEAIVRERLARYNAQEGRRGQGMHGRAFDAVFAEGMERQVRKRLTSEQLRLCMLASKLVPMDAKTGAVAVEGHRYWSPELGAVKRQKVTVRFDPERMELPAYVYSQDGRLLATAERVLAGSFDRASDGREHGKALRDWTRGQKLQAKAIRTLEAQDVAARLQGAAPPPPLPAADANVVAPNFKAARRADQLGGAKPDRDFERKWQAGVAGLRESG